MKVYVMTKRRTHLLQAYSVLFVGLFLFLFSAYWVLLPLMVSREEWENFFGYSILAVIVLLIGLVLCLEGWWRLRFVPYEIYIFDSGIVEFKRHLDSVTMNATEMQVKRKHLYSHEDDGSTRELRILMIQHPYGRFTVNEFYWHDDFMAHLLSLNPAIVVQGSWTI